MQDRKEDTAAGRSGGALPLTPVLQLREGRSHSTGDASTPNTASMACTPESHLLRPSAGKALATPESSLFNRTARRLITSCTPASRTPGSAMELTPASSLAGTPYQLSEGEITPTPKPRRRRRRAVQASSPTFKFTAEAPSRSAAAPTAVDVFGKMRAAMQANGGGDTVGPSFHPASGAGTADEEEAAAEKKNEAPASKHGTTVSEGGKGSKQSGKSPVLDDAAPRAEAAGNPPNSSAPAPPPPPPPVSYTHLTLPTTPYV